MTTFEAHPSEAVLRDLRQPSPFPGDEGELIGKDPREVPLGILSRYHGEKNPLKALRARCLDCCGSASEVRKCAAVACAACLSERASTPSAKTACFQPSKGNQWPPVWPRRGRPDDMLGTKKFGPVAGRATEPKGNGIDACCIVGRPHFLSQSGGSRPAASSDCASQFVIEPRMQNCFCVLLV
jgi:hypothetical protein